MSRGERFAVWSNRIGVNQMPLPDTCIHRRGEVISVIGQARTSDHGTIHTIGMEVHNYDMLEEQRSG